MKTKIIYIALLLVVTQTYGQRTYAADKYFKEYAYVKSAELYKKIVEKGNKSPKVLERLADSYYFNSNTKEAEIWYAELLKMYSEEKNADVLFKYAQTLKTNKKYSESDAIMKEYLKIKESSAISSELSATPDYSETYSKKPEDIIIHLHNLSVNTEYSDFGGFVNDNKLYYASSKPRLSGGKIRKYKWNNQPFLNLYSAEIQSKKVENVIDSEVLELTDESILSTETINTRYHEATAIFTKDGQTMYFTRDNFDGKKRRSDRNRETHLKLYKASLVEGAWGKVEELPFNNDAYSIGHPALSPDEKTLYFVSDMPGGLGATDLYKVTINDDGKYGEPSNLGAPLNTEGREMFPFVSAENELYYSSDGHLGLGGLDIFKAAIKGEGFSKSENLEAPFNSNLDDFSYSVGKEGDKITGFFSSNREGGKGDDDIYSFVFAEKAAVICKQSITGVVTDRNSGKIIAEAAVKLIDASGKILTQVKSDSNGAYNFSDLDCATAFKVLGEKVDYKSDFKEVSTTKEIDAVIKADLKLTPLIVGNQIVINPIYFDFDKFNIRQDAAYELENIVTVMNNNPDMVIKIESHTDIRGTRSYNRRLSDNRAKSTRDYIISRGIASTRIESAIGYGEDQLLIDCTQCTEEEHQKNRRSYFYIVSGGKQVNVQGQ